MRTISAAIDNVLDVNTTVDFLIRAKFSSASIHYWSDRALTAAQTFDGQAYSAVVTQGGLSPLWFSLGKHTTTLEVDNSDGLITDLIDAGVILEGGEIAVCLQFRDVTPVSSGALGSWSAPFWRGFVSGASHPGRELVTLTLETGPSELSRRCPRRLKSTCHKPFADGHLCPYSVTDGYGKVNPVDTGTVTSGTSSTLVRTGYDFAAAGVEEDHIVMAWGTSAQLAVGVVTNVAVGTLTVDYWRFAGSPVSPPANGWSYEVGPEFSTCNGSKGDCIDRGMFGPNDEQGAEELNWSRKRYFGGWAPPAKVQYQVKIPVGIFKSRHMAKTPTEHESIEGQVIPIIVGTIKLKNLTPLAQAWDDEHFHCLTLIGEGRCQTCSSVKTDGDIPLDNVNPATSFYDDSFLLYGFGTADDSDAVTSGELTTEQQKQAIGSAQSRAAFKASTQAQYENDPWLFNNSDGDGISRDSLALIRTRIEAQLPEDHVASIDCLVSGLYVKQADDDWVTNPNPIDFCFYFWMNRVWGAGLDPAEFLHTASWTSESTYCDESVTQTQTEIESYNGTVLEGPEDGLTPVAASGKNWVLVDHIFEHSLAESSIEITQAGKEQTKTILTSYGHRYGGSSDDGEQSGDGSSHQYGGDDLDGREVTLIKISGNWESGKVPSDGDAFTITNQSGTTVSRYKANGKLGDTVEDALSFAESILENCFAKMFLKDGKIAVFCRQEANLTEVNALDDIADEGSSQNVVYRQGKYGHEPAVDWVPDKDPPNEITFEYIDRRDDYNKKTRSMRSSSAQLRRKNDLSYDSRDRNEKTLSYGLTTSLDQASRLAALELREYGQLSDGSHNGTIKALMPFRHGLPIEVGDVRALTLTRIPAWVSYGRIEDSALDVNSWQWTMEMRPHVNDNFDDTTDDLGADERPSNTGGGGSVFPVFPIESLTEGKITDSEGGLVQSVDVEFTLPS